MIDVNEHATPSVPIPSLAWVTGGLADRGAEPGWDAERQRRAEKAEAVGHLAGGLVHDFNNMLGVILGNLERVRRLLPEDTITSRCLADALTATDCATALASRLLAFVRQQPLQPQVVAVDRLLIDLKPLIEIATPGCVVTLDLDCAWQCLVDANQMENAVLNLAVNARDAMPGGGLLTIATRALDVGTEGGHAARAFVVLEVRDRGVGMSPEVQARASEPFFTTKGVGLGTGLGLSQVVDFATGCGGTVRLASEIGKGTLFTLHIPRSDNDSGGALRNLKAPMFCRLDLASSPQS